MFPCTSSSLCRGFISLEGKSYVLEPSAHHSDGTHWIYAADLLNFAPGTCGHDFNMSYPNEHADSSLFRTFSSRVRIIKLSDYGLICLLVCVFLFGVLIRLQLCLQRLHLVQMLMAVPLACDTHCALTSMRGERILYRTAKVKNGFLLWLAFRF